MPEDGGNETRIQYSTLHGIQGITLIGILGELEVSEQRISD